ncbi:MAG TPA: hypothetical protein V6D22_13700 [Candidatus Obscuribacterales bacterium]
MSDERQEIETNGSVTSGSDSVCSCGNSRFVALCAVFWKTVRTDFEHLPQSDRSAAIKILANWIGVICLAFVVCSFIYPDRVNTAIASLGSLATIIALIVQHKAGKKDG